LLLPPPSAIQQLEPTQRPSVPPTVLVSIESSSPSASATALPPTGATLPAAVETL